MSAVYAIVEVMGHQRHAGLCSEVVIAGVPLLAIVQPAWERTYKESEYDFEQSCRRFRTVTERYAEVTIELGGSAIFRRVRCTEAQATAALPGCTWPLAPERVEGPLEDAPTRPALPGPVEDAEEVEDDTDTNDGVPW